MKALVYHGPGKKSWEEVPDARIEESGDVVVRVDTTTICGTDLHILHGDVAAVTDGRILGSGRSWRSVMLSADSASAIVSSYQPSRSAAGVPTARWECLRTAARSAASGGSSATSSTGHRPNWSACRSRTHRCTRCPIRSATSRPSSWPIRSRLGTRSACSPAGCGPATRLPSWGRAARTIAVDSNKFRLERALEFGATDTVEAGPGAIDEILAMTDGLGVDVAIEAVGYPETLRTAAALVRPGGTIANIGVPVR